MSIIKLEKIIKNYTTGSVVTEVLKGIDLEVQKGEWLAIMGKSGAGKSTLMYQMGLLDVPNSGSVEIEDLDISNLTEKERTYFRLTELGYVFQDYALLPELSAIENVIIPMMMQGETIEEAKRIAINSLTKLGLDHRLNNKPSQLSGGEQQRVSIARAVAKNPRILFADEPTANLDSVSSEEVIDALKKLHDAGQTVVMVTHEEEYTKYCNRILWMEDGVITKEKKPSKKTVRKKKITTKKTAKKVSKNKKGD